MSVSRIVLGSITRPWNYKLSNTRNGNGSTINRIQTLYVGITVTDKSAKSQLYSKRKEQWCPSHNIIYNKLIDTAKNRAAQISATDHNRPLKNVQAISTYQTEINCHWNIKDTGTNICRRSSSMPPTGVYIYIYIVNRFS